MRKYLIVNQSLEGKILYIAVDSIIAFEPTEYPNVTQIHTRCNRTFYIQKTTDQLAADLGIDDGT